MLRRGEIVRKTSETDITLSLSLDGQGEWRGNTSVPFLNHLLAAFTRHGLFNLEVQATGDLEVDDHHTVEDVGICLGKALREALGDKRGIVRFGSALVPMDDALAMVAVDLSGRAYLSYNVNLPTAMVGTFATELVEEFWQKFTEQAGITMHIRLLEGRNTHHIIEAIFKAAGRALRVACEFDARVPGVPSTKGQL
ncbi:MAG: imidazoleglycerol-phosphate dehydratase HisB [Firmicutes bacterium]|nr:imidazoleglycerol-phosphate dehydratase HisB [Bacillota bacterium]